MNNLPIGVFDSGLGGLSVWVQLRGMLPRESLIYYGEGKHCPFGGKSRDEITEYTDLAVRRLLDRGAKMIVIACNAATAMAIDHLRSTYDVPFVGLEPAVKPAAERTKTGVIGILATEAALDGRHFRETSAKYSGEVEIVARVGEGFVELVEGDMEDTPEALETVGRALQPIIEKNADQIVLGCTHYPFLADAICKTLDERGHKAEIIDPAQAIGRRVGSVLNELGLDASPDNEAVYEFMTSSGETYRRKLEDKSLFKFY